MGIELELTAAMQLGDAVHDFFESDVGRYIVGCVEQEIEAAFIAFEKVDPTDIIKTREIQNRIWRARSFITWLSELIMGAEQAKQTIMESEE